MTTQRQFYMACENGTAEEIQRFLQDPRVDPAAENQAALFTAVRVGNIDVVRVLLLDPRVDPSLFTQYVLRWACQKGHVDIVHILLRNPRVDPTVHEQEPIRNACYVGNTDLVRLLLQDPRVDPSVMDQEALRVACRDNRVEVVLLLLQDPRVDPSAHEQAAFRSAILSSDSGAILRMLLQHPKVNPTITPEKASILQTMPSRTLEHLRRKSIHPYDWNQLIVSVDHWLDKTLIQKKARNLQSLRRSERYGLGNLPNNVRTHIGKIVAGKVGPNLQSQIDQLKGNYYGPRRQTRRMRS